MLILPNIGLFVALQTLILVINAMIERRTENQCRSNNSSLRTYWIRSDKAEREEKRIIRSSFGIAIIQNRFKMWTRLVDSKSIFIHQPKFRSKYNKYPMKLKINALLFRGWTFISSAMHIHSLILVCNRNTSNYLQWKCSVTAEYFAFPEHTTWDTEHLMNNLNLIRRENIYI